MKIAGKSGDDEIQGRGGERAEKSSRRREAAAAAAAHLISRGWITNRYYANRSTLRARPRRCAGLLSGGRIMGISKVNSNARASRVTGELRFWDWGLVSRGFEGMLESVGSLGRVEGFSLGAGVCDESGGFEECETWF